MRDKLNCFECKNWFDVNELIYLPTEQYYLCHHDAATHYAIKCETLRAELQEEKARNELFEKCLHRALKMWQEANPDADYWISGDKNIVWILEQLDEARAVVEAAREAKKQLGPLYRIDAPSAVITAYNFLQGALDRYDEERAAALERVTK